ncbi:hypothetical protein PAECIP111893_01408 [Paenibacillus plantiphilus]|uniref:Helix-turn-helix conjugative transposon-like domain-containing protein n=1 Tax=Paenibacillus plantiphilus TaxID=2905650 RepID=A0ABM9C3K2_9BACL|nr:helix-turn-helix domain-containing protein [Paenibacillus plantiphilus]CAH1200517.1 hypothetical protein PAECIP111893_01408 [Paenibacillus plantiphilus]
MENELYDLVSRAQRGDKDALSQVIDLFSPAIRSARSHTKQDLQDDLEQTIVETVIKKIMSYNLDQTPDFSTFCRRLSSLNNKDN